MRSCATRYCRNKITHRKHCSTCRARMSREADPVRYAYNNLRSSAAKRNILFTITLDQFRTWCRKVDYIGRSGRSASSYTIDRRYNDVGYHIDNIAVMTKIDNIKKYWSYDWRSKRVFILDAEPVESDLPF